MALRTGYHAGLAALAIALLARPAVAAPCAPARVTTDTASFPEPWRRALASLVEATAREGLPWSCNGARLALAFGGPGAAARLTVTMDGWPVLARDVPSPDELVPIGEAVLARPIEGAARLAAPVAEPALPPDPPPMPVLLSLAPPPPAEPRLLVDALTSARYSGHVDAVWAGLELRVAIPIESFSVAIWARYEISVHAIQPIPSDFTMTSGSVGLAAGYRVLTRPVELTVALAPSIAVITMDGGPDNLPMQSANGAKGDPRLGARLQAALPFSSRWRGLFALDGELAPLALASARHRTIDPLLPPIPSFTLGASLGGELVLR